MPRNSFDDILNFVEGPGRIVAEFMDLPEFENFIRVSKQCRRQSINFFRSKKSAELSNYTNSDAVRFIAYIKKNKNMFKEINNLFFTWFFYCSPQKFAISRLLVNERLFKQSAEGLVKRDADIVRELDYISWLNLLITKSGIASVILFIVIAITFIVINFHFKSDYKDGIILSFFAVPLDLFMRVLVNRISANHRINELRDQADRYLTHGFFKKLHELPDEVIVNKKQPGAGH